MSASPPRDVVALDVEKEHPPLPRGSVLAPRRTSKKGVRADSSIPSWREHKHGGGATPLLRPVDRRARADPYGGRRRPARTCAVHSGPQEARAGARVLEARKLLANESSLARRRVQNPLPPRKESAKARGSNQRAGSRGFWRSRMTAVGLEYRVPCCGESQDRATSARFVSRRGGESSTPRGPALCARSIA